MIEMKKKSSLWLDIDFYQRGLLITLLDATEHILKVYSTKRRGKRDKQYVALFESFLNLYKAINRTKIGVEVVVFFYDMMQKGWNISHLRYKRERQTEYQKALKKVIDKAERLKQKINVHEYC